MPHHTVYIRLLNAIFDAHLKLEGVECWHLLPNQEKRRLMAEPDYVPPLHWLVGICGEIRADVHYIVYGDEMALRPPLDSAMIKAARDLSKVADEEGWSWVIRSRAWAQGCATVATRSAGAIDFKRLTAAHWRRVGASYKASPKAELSVTRAPARQAIKLYTCIRDYPLPFVCTECPHCHSSEYVVELR